MTQIDTLEELVAYIERAHPGWEWLVRSNACGDIATVPNTPQVGYFANIVRAHPAPERFPAYGATPLEALSKSLKRLQLAIMMGVVK